jgi:hypothetical protein
MSLSLSTLGRERKEKKAFLRNYKGKLVQKRTTFTCKVYRWRLKNALKRLENGSGRKWKEEEDYSETRRVFHKPPSRHYSLFNLFVKRSVFS